MLNNIGLPGLLLIVVVTLLLFGRGKVGALMGEVGTGLAAFRKGLREETDDTPAPPAARGRPEDGQA
ncbi:MAG: twin-arginine translocase TatA/TatE family subunit [Rhodobacteraceae bacterium]|jgi:sec-independent protein translocase protein TatA|nr:twin-arginine translocase TatA/TatE family subunit [Paracoccaceae bacterium]